MAPLCVMNTIFVAPDVGVGWVGSRHAQVPPSQCRIVLFRTRTSPIINREMDFILILAI